jgi:hypothetical protein
LNYESVLFDSQNQTTPQIMTTPTEVQALLRFLAQDAKQPVAKAMGQIKALQAASLTT